MTHEFVIFSLPVYLFHGYAETLSYQLDIKLNMTTETKYKVWPTFSTILWMSPNTVRGFYEGKFPRIDGRLFEKYIRFWKRFQMFKQTLFAIPAIPALHTLIALMHVYVTQANFTTKPRFEIKNKRSFTEMNSQGSRVEKNTHAQKVQMQKILFTNEACWWNLLVWRNHA